MHVWQRRFIAVRDRRGRRAAAAAGARFLGQRPLINREGLSQTSFIPCRRVGEGGCLQSASELDQRAGEAMAEARFARSLYLAWEYFQASLERTWLISRETRAAGNAARSRLR